MTRLRAGGFCLGVVACIAGGGPGGPHGSAAQTAAAALAPVGPLGHWKGDDAAAADASGNGFHGTCSTGARTSATCPATKFQNPGSFDLDGATGLVSIPDAPALRIGGDITIAFWKRKTANVNDWVRLVGKGNPAQRNYGVWEYPGGDGRVKFQIYNSGGGSILELDSPAGTPLNTWAHIACTVSVNAAAVYVNGALVANGTRTGDPGTGADPLTFGHAGYHGFFSGQLDDVRIYDRALSMGEIVHLAGGHGPPAGPTDLVATAAGPRQVALSWTASASAPPAGTATYYIVKRSTTRGKGHATVASFLTAPTHTDTRPDDQATSYYVVTAVNTGGESPPSNEVTVPQRLK